ncbi:MAG: CotH kinase family protein [Clostridium sp.]|nr:CotH kinase family protein [Clostridium sp.]
MEENKRFKTLLAAAGAILLVLLAGYPAVKEKINEYRKKDISLEQLENSAGEESSPTGDGAVSGEEELKKALAEQGLTGGQGLDGGRELSQVVLSLEEGPQEFYISLWQSGEGICYFFLPGFARGEGLVLERAGGGSILIGDIRVYEGDILKDILEEESYDFALLDGEGSEVLKGPLVFLYSSDLPVLSLATESGDMEFINESKENEEAGRAALFDEGGQKLYEGEAESIRGRGNSTWGLAKKPYKIKLSREADFFGFGASDSWNLLANGYDETRLRNEIALGLAAELEMKYVPEGRMVDLYINDSYYGNYYLTEKIKVGEGSVAIRDMEEMAGAIYSPEELERLERLENEDGTRKWTSVGFEEEDLTGGYLLERELETRYKTEISGFVTSQGDCYTLQSPRYASKGQVDYIADLMQEFQDAIEEKDGVHPRTGKHYSEYIDAASFIQKYLVEEISKNYDGGVTSSFFYKPQDSASGKIFAGPVWDYDVAFGNCNLDKIASNPMGITKLNDHVYGTDVFARLYEKEDFYSQMVEMYREKALPYLDKLLDYQIDKLVEKSRKSAAMDSIRWAELENRYQYYEEYDNDVRYLKYFIERRRDFLNEVWLEGVSYHDIAFMVDGEVWQIMCVKDGETAGSEPIPVRYKESSLFMGWATESGVPYDGYKPVYEDMTFHAIWQELPAKEPAP